MPVEQHSSTADSSTVRHLEALGVGAGWRCLEVGGGGGSVGRWLGERVGSDGTPASCWPTFPLGGRCSAAKVNEAVVRRWGRKPLS
ncbi:MAG: hypothetical protein ACRDY7_09630 [Acidimicrobiia bacterium]